MATDNSLIAFKAISKFINDLSEMFGDSQKSLQLYSFLLSRTTLSHEVAISKHVDIFRTFCVDNRDAMSCMDSSKLMNPLIKYSEKVSIDMTMIFASADASTTKTIWKHFLTISAIVDPTGEARKILKEVKSQGNESDFLCNMMEKIEKNVDSNVNPMDAISSMMSSGIFTELIGGMGSGIQDGTLDLGKLMGTVQKMVSKMSPETESCINIEGLINNMKNSDGNGGEQPLDIMSLLGPMMSVMTNIQSQPTKSTIDAPQIEENNLKM